MASKYLVSTTLIGHHGEVGQLMDDIKRDHPQVGGLYITQREHDIMQEVLMQSRPWTQLPCRIQEMCGYFTSLGRDQVFAEETFNICRFSLGLSKDQMRQMWSSFFAQFEEDQATRRTYDETLHPIMRFVRFLIQDCTVKEEEFIRENCFTLPYCLQHDACKVMHQKFKGKARLCCCAKQDCHEFTNFNVMKAEREPEAKIINQVVILD